MSPRTMMAISLLAAGSLSPAANASMLWSGSGTGSGPLAASADFSLSAGNLVVTLTNTGTGDVLVPTDVFTAILFDITGSPMSLTRTSAVLNSGSTVYYDPNGQPAGGVVGGEWAYVGGLSGAPGNRAYGISSTGLNLFGPGDLFPGPNLSGPSSPDGLQYGLTSAGDDPATGNGGVTGSGGLIKDSVVFTLGGAGATFDLSRITNVFFLYGTAVGEGGFSGHTTPAPGAAALLGLGGIMILARRRSR